MAVTKISVSLSPVALAVIDGIASERGLTRSAWIEQAALREARRIALGEALKEYERSSGRPMTVREIDAARRTIYGAKSGAE